MKSCGSDASMLASSWRKSFSLMTVTTKPDHWGERAISRKTIAWGMPDESRCDRGDYLVCFLFLHMRLRRVERPAFPAPSEFQMASHRQNSRGSRGENAELWVFCAAPLRTRQRHHGSSSLLREAVRSRRAKLALSFPSSREAVGRVAHRERSERCAGWGCFRERGICAL